jgi:hypothetical protein
MWSNEALGTPVDSEKARARVQNPHGAICGQDRQTPSVVGVLGSVQGRGSGGSGGSGELDQGRARAKLICGLPL